MKNFNLYLLLFVIYYLTTIIRVVPDGFHPDSLVYMSMASNLGDGASSFWHLHFTTTRFNEFYEHPPLGIFTMAIPFYVFGDTLLIDKFYGIFFGFFFAFLISLIVELVVQNQKKNTFLLSLFYFLAFPIVGNTLENNLLEIPATFFILLSVYIFLRYIKKQGNIFLYSFGFSLTLIFAFLVKGPVTIFTFALPFFYFLLFSKTYSFKEVFKFYTLTLLFILTFSLLLYLYPPSKHYLMTYFDKQILSSIDGSRGGNEHLKLTKQLLIDFSSIFLISMIAISITSGRMYKPKFTKFFWLFILIGLSGSLPLEVSPRQHDYYIFPSLAFFAIALAILFTQELTNLVKKLYAYKLIYLLNTLLLIVAIVLSYNKIHTNSRYKNFYTDLLNTQVPIEKNSELYTCTNNPIDYDKFHQNIGLTANLKRHFNAELTQSNKNAPYYLTTINSLKSCEVQKSKYEYIGAKNANYYLLYKKITY